MIAEIRLLLFSGARNPAITLGGDEAESLFRQTTTLPPLQVRTADQRFPRLGYRGIAVLFRTDAGQLLGAWQCYYGEAIDLRARALLLDRNRELEHALFDRLARGHFVSMQSLRWDNIDAQGNERPIAGLTPPGLPDEPCAYGATDPHSKAWIKHMLLNNCYNYANDVLNVDPFTPPAMPGHMTGTLQGPPATLMAQLHAAILSDDLESLGNSVPAACPSPAHHVMLVMLRQVHPATTQLDFHCVRLDQEGTWSHLDASGYPRNTDDAGRPITDVTQAVFDGSPELVGVYMAIANNPKIGN